MWVLYTYSGGIVDYFDSRKDGEEYVWQKVNRKPRVSLDDNELKVYANLNFALVDEPVDNIIEDFKYTLKSLGVVLSIAMPSINRNGDAAYFRNLKTDLDSAANKVTGHNRSPWFSMGDAGPGIVDDVIHAGEPVSFRRSNWDVLWKDPRSLVFSGIEPITEDRAEFLTAIRDSYSNRLYLNIGG